MPEHGRAEALDAMARNDRWASCRIAWTESYRVLALAGRSTEALREDWARTDVIDVDQELCERAGELARTTGLRTLDALHLASALRVDDGALTFATWDRPLWDAAGENGFALVPAARP